MFILLNFMVVFFMFMLLAQFGAVVFQRFIPVGINVHIIDDQLPTLKIANLYLVKIEN